MLPMVDDCDLTGVADGQSVPVAVASIMGIQRRHDRSMTERIGWTRSIQVLGGGRG